MRLYSRLQPAAKLSMDEICWWGAGHNGGEKTTLPPNRDNQDKTSHLKHTNTARLLKASCAKGAAAASCRKNAKSNLRCENPTDVSGSWRQPAAGRTSLVVTHKIQVQRMPVSLRHSRSKFKLVKAVKVPHMCL